MSTRIASVFVVAAILLAGAALASPLDRKHTVTLTREALIGDTLVPAGTYRVELAAAPEIARFVQGKRTVVEAPVKVGLERPLYAGNALHYRTVEGRERLVKIVFAGSGLAVEFPTDPAGGTDAPIATAADRP